MSTSELTLNNNVNVTKQCVKVVHNFGYDTYVNICKSPVTDVPWGSMDYIKGTIILVLLMAAVLGFVLAVSGANDE